MAVEIGEFMNERMFGDGAYDVLLLHQEDPDAFKMRSISGTGKGSHIYQVTDAARENLAKMAIRFGAEYVSSERTSAYGQSSQGPSGEMTIRGTALIRKTPQETTQGTGTGE